MFAKYNLNFWYKEVVYFNRFFFESLRHMYWVLVVPIFIGLNLIKNLVNLLFLAPKLKRQVAPGKWEELPNYDLKVPPKFL